MVILFTDFLGHNVMQRFRDAASREGVMFVTVRATPFPGGAGDFRDRRRA